MKIQKLLPFIILLFSSVQKHVPNGSPHFDEALEIYEKIARATGDARLYPELVKDDRISIAHYHKEDNHIAINPKILDYIHKKHPKQAQDAIALILGHELAHFYKDHGLDHGFSAKKEKDNNAAPQQLLNQTFEKQADKFAIYYSHLAGYNAGAISEDFINGLYKDGIIPKGSPDYPSQAERREIYQEATKEIQAAIRKFDAGNLLMLMKEYQGAIWYFEDVAKEYPTREIFNNMAVANVRLALQYFDPDPNGDLKGMLYPVEFDTEISLGKINRGGTRTHTEDTSNKRLRRSYLEKALHYADRSIGMDNYHSPAHLNKACVLILQAIDSDELNRKFLHSSAKNSLGQYKIILEHFKIPNAARHLVNVEILEAIITLNEGDIATAKEKMKAIKDSPIATYNWKVLAKATIENDKNPIIQCPNPISNWRFKKREPNDQERLVNLLKDATPLQVYKNIDNWVSLRSERKKGMEYVLFRLRLQGQEHKIYALRPLPHYKGKTCHDLGSGSAQAQMIDVLGSPEPQNIQQSQRLVYYLYTIQAHIIYGVNAEGEVQDMVYFYSNKPKKQ